jgi:hypothetical protein
MDSLAAIKCLADLARIFHGMPLYELVEADFGSRRSDLACFEAIV